MSLSKFILRLKGGSGSGNFGHSGIPGHQGGSIPKGEGSVIESAPANYIDLNNRDNAQEFMDDMGNWENSISGAMANKIADYTMQSYSRINDSMRSFEGKNPITAFSNPEDRGTYLSLHNSLARAQTPYPITVYRGANKNIFENLKVGDTYTEKAFTSTSMSKSEAKTHVEKNGSDGIMVEVKVPKGSMAAPIGRFSQFTTHNEGDEKEVLLQWGMNYKVVSKTKNKVVVEAIGPSWKK